MTTSAEDDEDPPLGENGNGDGNATVASKEDGTLMYPHLQKFMPPVPSRFVQTRESTQAAISDTYNGDGKVYSALRAAAYVSWGIVTSLGAPSETGLRA